MKINSVEKSNMINMYNKQKQMDKSKSAEKIPKDKVIISEAAKYLSELNSKGEEIDIDKVREIKSKMEAGTYSVSPGKLAKKILDAIKGE